jgi:hypothetical protein
MGTVSGANFLLPAHFSLLLALLEEAGEEFDGLFAGAVDGLNGVAGVVGTKQHAVTEAPKRGFCRQRLNFHDLQGGGMDVAACQGRREVGFVHQRAAGDVDDADEAVDFTTMDDVAAYTAAAAMDPTTPRLLRIAALLEVPMRLV